MAIFLLQTLAGIGVANGQHEEAQTEGQHENIEHEKLLAAAAAKTAASAFSVTGGASFAIGFRGGRPSDVIGIS